MAAYISHGKPVTNVLVLLCREFAGQLGKAYMARSKKSITPPMRNRPPVSYISLLSSLAFGNRCAEALDMRTHTTRAENHPNFYRIC